MYASLSLRRALSRQNITRGRRRQRELDTRCRRRRCVPCGRRFPYHSRDVCTFLAQTYVYRVYIVQIKRSMSVGSTNVWCTHVYANKPANGRRLWVEVLQHSVLRRVYIVIVLYVYMCVCVCAAMFNETTGAVCPSHNKYTRLSPRHPVTVVLLLPVHLVIALPPAPPLHGLYGHSSHRRRPSFRGALCRSIENAILLYCTHAHARAYVHTTSLAVQPRNDDVSPPPPLPLPPLDIPPLSLPFLRPKRVPLHTHHSPTPHQPSPSRRYILSSSDILSHLQLPRTWYLAAGRYIHPSAVRKGAIPEFMLLCIYNETLRRVQVGSGGIMVVVVVLWWWSWRWRSSCIHVTLYQIPS